MAMPASKPHLAALATILLVLATALPVVFLTTPPMIDVLGHIGRYALQTGLDAHPWLQPYYTYHWQLIGNLGADLLVEGLQPLVGVLGATRIVVALVPLLSTSGILLLSRQVHGRTTPFAIVALTLVYGLPFTWGFLNFSLSMGLALHAFALSLRLEQQGRQALRAAMLVPVGLAVWLCHTFGWAFLGILCTAQGLVRAHKHHGTAPGILRATVRSCLPLLAPLLPMLIWRSSAAGSGIEGWFDFGEKIDWLFSILRMGAERPDRLSAGLLITLIPATLLSARTSPDRTLITAAALTFTTFVLLPKQIFGSVFADMRLAPYVVLLALLALRDDFRSRWVRPALIILAIAFLGFRLVLSAHVYHERERILDRHLVALTHIPDHARVAMLVEIPCGHDWELPWLSHLGSLAILHRGAFVNDQWANASMNPLRVTFPEAGAYAFDDKQLFFPARCGDRRTLGYRLRELPTGAFTHVWIAGVAPSTVPRRPDLVPIWQRSDAVLFRVGTMAGGISKLSKLQP